jgi:site-specific DNA-methyltransferase (cytosine-N4-specific)
VGSQRQEGEVSEWRIITADVLDGLAQLESGSVQSCVTSPPYFPAIRDYGVVGQIGEEETPGEYIDKLVEIFRDVRRVLSLCGACWIVIGDSYCNDDKWGGYSKLAPNSRRRTNKGHSGIAPRSLFLIPQRLMIALQEDGWLVRAEVIWNKQTTHDMNGNRPHRSHETILFMTRTTKNKYSPDDLTVWNVAPARIDWHSAIFPVELPRRMIEATTDVGDLVLDPFSGAGTTGLVAVQLGRRYVGIEINAEYVEMSEARIRAGYGVTAAQLADDGDKPSQIRLFK